MQISKSTGIFFSIILLTGILTIFTDLQRKKIYNNHLIIGAILGVVATVYTFAYLHEDILFHLINGLIAFAAGSLLHRFGLWRGGDAKLFTLYAFLMPALEAGHLLISSAINLFACSFIAGAIVLVPFYIKDLASNHNAVISKLFSPPELKILLNAVKTTVFYSWVLFPVYYYARLIHFPAMSLVITYLIFFAVRRYLKKVPGIKQYIFLAIGIAFGFVMRAWLNPPSLSWPLLAISLVKIGLFSFLSAFIYTTLGFLKEYHERIAFAPLLFMGCVLSYTPFLTWIMRLLRP